MKIGLITFHETTNFGSFLQTYGLYKAINNLGYDCEVIDYKCESIMKRELPKTKPESYSLRNLAIYLLLEKRLQKKYTSFHNTIYSCMKLSKPYNKYNIKEADKEYDAFVVGSDMLWNLSITDNDMVYFLDFVKDNKKKYAFSTSIGNRWNNKEIEAVCPFLQHFKRISLREKDSVNWISGLLDKKIEFVCDPTMLLEKDSWDELIENSVEIKEHYVLVYFYDAQMIEDAKKYAAYHQYKIWFINYGKPIKGVKNIHPYHISEFLSLIKNAKTVFTASYHGMLFSIYFEVPFYCYMRENGNNVRFHSVFERLNLWQCYQINNEAFKETVIDYDKVADAVKEWRGESLAILASYWEKEDVCLKET